MKTSVIIPTYNRPGDLYKCLESIRRQSLLPDELIVVDDGNLDHLPFWEALKIAGVHCIYRQKQEKGLTRSRNLGVALSSGDILIFFDDDVVLTQDYIKEIKDTYERSPDPDIGGISGIDLNLAAPEWFRYVEFFYNVVWLISPLKSGGVTASGFSEQVLAMRVNPCRHIEKAQALGGALFSFHKKVFDFFSFSEDYDHNYCQGEDKDFSYRVSKRFNLYIQPRAKLYHFLSPVERMAKYRRGRDLIFSAFRLFDRYVKRYPGQILLFYYSVLGYFIKFGVIAAMRKSESGERDRLRGIKDAAWMISMRHRRGKNV